MASLCTKLKMLLVDYQEGMHTAGFYRKKKWYGNKQNLIGDGKVQRNSVSQMHGLEQRRVEVSMFWGG